MARARGFGRPAKKIDNLRWLGSTVATFGAFGAGSSALTVVAAGSPRDTIMRTRGEVLIGLDSAQSPGALVLISMGLVLVPEGQGTTVIWDPFGDSEAPWFWHQEVSIGYEEMVTDVVANQGIQFARIVVDSKAMRKANVDEEIQLVVTNTTLLTARSVNISASFRFLLGN